MKFFLFVVFSQVEMAKVEEECNKLATAVDAYKKGHKVQEKQIKDLNEKFKQESENLASALGASEKFNPRRETTR